jgi:Tfp pilus assembly protein PilV
MPLQRRRGYVLLEAMFGVLIFSLGVLAMGEAVNNCLMAEMAKMDSDRARLALQNRMAEFEADAVPIVDGRVEELKGMFQGITLKVSRKPVDAKGDKGESLNGLFVVTLEAFWKSGTLDQSKSLTFHVYRSS